LLEEFYGFLNPACIRNPQFPCRTLNHPRFQRIYIIRFF
jgi:hypothetical protein